MLRLDRTQEELQLGAPTSTGIESSEGGDILAGSLDRLLRDLHEPVLLLEAAIKGRNRSFFPGPFGPLYPAVYATIHHDDDICREVGSIVRLYAEATTKLERLIAGGEGPEQINAFLGGVRRHCFALTRIRDTFKSHPILSQLFDSKRVSGHGAPIRPERVAQQPVAHDDHSHLTCAGEELVAKVSTTMTVLSAVLAKSRGEFTGMGRLPWPQQLMAHNLAAYCAIDNQLFKWVHRLVAQNLEMIEYHHRPRPESYPRYLSIVEDFRTLLETANLKIEVVAELFGEAAVY